MSEDDRTPGIDVSHWQGAVDWEAVKMADIAFAFIKATQGARGTDGQFSANWEAARAEGIVRGAYHFFSPAVSPALQLANFLEAVRTLEPDDLPPALDLEEDMHNGQDRWDGVPQAARVGLAVEWLEGVARQLGRTPIVYTRRGFVSAKLGDVTALARYPLWIAHYGVTTPHVPPAWARWTFWQHSDRGNVPGVAGDIDCNWFAGSPADLRAL